MHIHVGASKYGSTRYQNKVNEHVHLFLTNQKLACIHCLHVPIYIVIKSIQVFTIRQYCYRKSAAHIKQGL